jgi:hypothetical protein
MSSAIGHRLILALAVGAALLVGCGSSPQAACQEQVKTYAQQINPITAEWNDATKRAGSAPPANLAPAIDGLQAIRQRTDGVTVPECAKGAHGILTRSMDMEIQGFKDTLAQKPATTVQQEFSDAAKAFGDFQAEILRLAGAP